MTSAVAAAAMMPMIMMPCPGVSASSRRERRGRQAFPPDIVSAIPVPGFRQGSVILGCDTNRLDQIGKYSRQRSCLHGVRVLGRDVAILAAPGMEVLLGGAALAADLTHGRRSAGAGGMRARPGNVVTWVLNYEASEMTWLGVSSQTCCPEVSTVSPNLLRLGVPRVSHRL